MVQAALLSCPLKQTSEIDWVSPLKSYIRMHYDDDPDKYSEECATLNRLRQDMRGAGSDSTSGRDLLYRYYGQLEMLDLRFPVDENNIKISFTWYDAFTTKPTSQYSLAFEKASVIFNISAVLSCHAAIQDLSDEAGFKAAYYALQLSAGMFTYINENFLHAPSTDLDRDTVKTLIHIMLAQAHEIFLQRQIREGTRSALVARVAAGSQNAYAQAKEGLEAEFAKTIFDPSWLKLVQVKTLHLTAVSEYYQALAEGEGKRAGSAIARLQAADRTSKQAFSLAKAFPATPSPGSNLGPDTASTIQTATKKQMEMIQEKLASFIKDNDFIFHQTVPAEATLSAVTPFSPGKAIPISDMYKHQDIQKITGPDIFRKIMPRWVVESVSRYDEERRKFVSNEFEKARDANDTMEAWMNSLGLPQILNVFKGVLDREIGPDPEFARWCGEISEHRPFSESLAQIQEEKTAVLNSLSKSNTQLNMEESICEKMRSKYDSEWTQQPSSRLNATLRSDIKSYQDTVGEATNSDNQLISAARQYEKDFEELRDAGSKGEADMLYQQAIMSAGAAGRGQGQGEDSLIDADYGQSGPSLADQIGEVETMLRSWEKLKKERKRLLEQLRTASLADDISENVLVNKKSIPAHEQELFQAELSKYDAQVGELAKAYHIQQSRRQAIDMKYKELLTDKRVTANRERFEQIHKVKSSVMNKYRKIYTAHKDLVDGTRQAENFYAEMKESVTSLGKNVEAFLSNRRAEGAQLLNKIEQTKSSAATGSTASENERLHSLMAKLSMDPSSSSSVDRPGPAPSQQSTTEQFTGSYPTPNPDPRFTIPPRESPVPVVPNGYTHPLNRAESVSTPQTTSPKVTDPAQQQQQQQHPFSQGLASPLSQPYNPMAYPEKKSPLQGGHFSPQQQQQQQQQHQPSQSHRFPQSPHQQGSQLTATNVQQPGYFPPQSHTPQPQTQLHHQQNIQSPVQAMTFTSPSSQYPPHYQFPMPGSQQHPSFPYQQPPHAQHPYPGYAYPGGPGPGLGPAPTPTPGPYNMPQNYIPPPPPPGPPGGGSTTQYPPYAGAWPSGPGGYANYQRPPTAQGQRGDANPQQPTPPAGQSDIWAGLSAWK